MVTIKGAGIQGLAAAWTLREFNPVIYEREKRAGGWIRTCLEGNYLFEIGPRGFRPKGNGLYTLELIKELGLEKELICPPDEANIRYIYTETGLKRFPGEFKSLILGGVLRDLFLPAKPFHTIYDYFSYRFGTRFAKQIVDPALSGIYAGDIRKLSLKGCFPDIEAIARSNRSLIFGLLKKEKSFKDPKWSKYPLLSFKEGMETLTRHLSKRFTIHYEIERPCDIDCTPRYENRASLLVINLGYSKPVLKYKGFGYLVPSYLNEPILGCVFDSNVFPEHNQTIGQTRLTLMSGGALFPERLDDPLILEKSLFTLKKHLGINIDPDYIKITKCLDAIPQYDNEGDGNGVNDAIKKGVLKGRCYAAVAP
ncbi:MAG: protoporphyrinogen/coproporphyrinogen oxidase [Parachlamydiaceae bacterium]